MHPRSLYMTMIRLLPDKLFVYLYYAKFKHRLLPLRNPRRFSEKLAWLKMYGRMERFAPYADKFTVRKYIEQKIGADYLIPLMGVWDDAADIPFDLLPKRFVLKVTHGCGYNYICKDKSTIDPAKVRAIVDGWMHENFYEQEREPQYKRCTPRIVCETYLEDETGSLRDYKFWCSKGEPKIIQIDTDRFTNHKSDLLDMNWQKLDYVQAETFGVSSDEIKKPQNLDEMMGVARQLSQNFPFVRVDLYSVNGKTYFGELTFTPGSGMVDMDSGDGDMQLGTLIDLNAYNV